MSYRLLETGEIIEENDEIECVFVDKTVWKPVGLTTGFTVLDPEDSSYRKFRRLVK